MIPTKSLKKQLCFLSSTTASSTALMFLTEQGENLLLLSRSPLVALAMAFNGGGPISFEYTDLAAKHLSEGFQALCYAAVDGRMFGLQHEASDINEPKKT